MLVSKYPGHQIDYIDMRMTSQTAVSIEHICRICAEKSGDFIPIFKHIGIELKLYSKIETHLKIKVDICDTLPQQVCKSCVFKLNICHDLLKTAKAADLKLHRLFKNSSKETVEVSINDDDDASCSINGEQFQLLNEKTVNNEICQTENKIVLDEKSLNVQYEISVTSNVDGGKDVEKNQQLRRPNETVNDNNGDTFTLEEHISSQRQNESSLISVSDRDNLSDDQHKTEENVDSCKNNVVVVKKVVTPESVYYNTFPEKETTIEIAEQSKSKSEQIYPNLSCPQCGKVCQSFKGLDVHISTHSDVSPYLCDLCGKKFKHVNNLLCHKRTHREESLKKTHMCSFCNTGFRSKFHLSEHMNIHNDLRPYQCSKCNKTFHKRIHLRQHASTHVSEKDKVVCETCGSRFTRRSNLMQHIRKCHAENRTYKCRICLSEFPTLGLLLSHRSIHTQDNIKQQHNLSENSYSCHICGKIFLKKRSYQLHSQSHSGENKCWCDICGKLLSSKASLNYHKKAFHCSERKWHCQYCGKGYMSNQLQLIHERTHTGVKPYTCSVCKKSFSGTNSLNQHMKKHLDMRNFECTYCLKRFQRKATLMVHLRTHTGERPYICDICGHRFTQKNDMLKHQKTHQTAKNKPQKTESEKDSSNTAELQCELCNTMFDSKDELGKHKSSHDVTVPVVFTVQNNDVLSTITEIITDDCQAVITLSDVEPYNTLKTDS